MGNCPGAYPQPVRCRPLCQLVGKLKEIPPSMGSAFYDRAVSQVGFNQWFDSPRVIGILTMGLAGDLGTLDK